MTDHETEITPSLIIGQTAQYFSFTIEQLCSNTRTPPLVQARHIAMYLCRELTDLSLPNIAREFGGKDHTTVMHGVKKIKALISERPAVYARVSELTYRIKQQASS